MADETNPQATTQPTAEDTAAGTAPETTETAPEGNPPVVDGIIRLRAPDGALYDYSINSFDAAAAQQVYTLLPSTWQSKIDAQAAFFQNYQRTITDIPEELRAPGALEKLLKQIHQQGGYLSEETSPAVRAWLDGPDTAGLRSSGLFKGYKTAGALADLGSGVLNFLGDLPSAYYDGLLLPVRGLLYAGNVAVTELSKMPSITPEQAKSMATAYQGMMYMATESEFAPKETKSSAPGTVSTIGGGVQSFFNNTAVFGFALWNMASGWLSGEDVTWDKAWKDAEDYWTEGKGLQTASEAAQTIAVGASLDEARPIVEEQLRSATIDGVEMAPYLGVEAGSLYTGPDGNVYTHNGPDEAPTPLLGPDGETPLKASEIETAELQSVSGSLFQDLSPSGVAASVAGGLVAPALTYKGVAEGYARQKILGEEPALKKAHAEAEIKLKTAQDAVDDYLDKSTKGQLKNRWGKPLDVNAAKKLGDALDADLKKAEGIFDNLDTKLNNLPANPIGDAKASKSPFTRALGHLTEAAEKKLPDDAKFFDKAVHRLTALGRGPGAFAGHTTSAVGNTINGIASGTAKAMTPGHAPRAGGSAATTTAEIINDVAERAPASWFGKFGEAAGKWGTRLGIGSAFIHPVINATNSTDTQGTVTYSAEGAAIVGATLWKSGGKFGLKALRTATTKIVPGLNLGVSSVDVIEGYRTGDNQKFRDGSVSLATQGIGTAIGGAIGGLGFLAGPVGFASVPAGMAIGSTVGGWLSMVTVPTAQYFWPAQQNPTPATTPTQPAAPAGAAKKPSVIAQAHAKAVRDFDADGSGGLNDDEITTALASAGITGSEANTQVAALDGKAGLSQKELAYVLGNLPPEEVTKLRMAVANGTAAGTSKTGFDAAAWARVSGNAVGA